MQNRIAQVAAYVNEGLPPRDIAKEIGVGFGTVFDYLDRAVGRGLIRRSDVYFTLSEERRASPSDNWSRETVKRYGSSAHMLGDMYEELRTIETLLHTVIKMALIVKYGDGEDGWWHQGIPISVRQKCQQRREDDSPPKAEPFGYTDLIDLHDILSKEWSALHSIVTKEASRKPEMLKALKSLNHVRKKVMHPVRVTELTESEFEFVHDLRNEISSSILRTLSELGFEMDSDGSFTVRRT